MALHQQDGGHLPGHRRHPALPVIAVVMERKTKQTYFEHEKTDNDWSLFDDDDDEDSDK